ncbi:MAG: cation diffusion facilitator family transporter [Candidatus Dormibacteria bacterium]
MSAHTSPRYLEPGSRSRHATLVALVVAGCLFLAKLVVGVLVVGSVAIISDAVHSGVDMVAAGLGYVAVRAANRPADDTHDFGHGKFESLFAAVQGLTILGLGLYVAYGALEKLLHGGTTRNELAGAVLIAAVLTVNLVLARYLGRVHRATGSAVVHATSLDVRADVAASAAVLVAVLVLAATHAQWVDSAVALLVAAYIVRAAVLVIRDATGVLVDRSLPLDEEDRISRLVQRQVGPGRLIEFHDLKTRRLGPERHVEMHVVVDGDMSVAAAHLLCDGVENDIRAEWPDTSITIHVEPATHRKT